MAAHGAVKAEISGDGLVVLVRDSALSKQLLCAQALRKLLTGFKTLWGNSGVNCGFRSA